MLALRVDAGRGFQMQVAVLVGLEIGLVERLELRGGQDQLRGDRFAVREVVVNIRGKHGLVALDEEARRFQPHDEIFRGDRVGDPVADLCGGGKAVAVDAPRRERIGEGDRGLGLAGSVSE